MIELMGEMVLCLIVAIVIGFFIGWIFSKTVDAEECDLDYDELSMREEEYSRQIKNLEDKYQKRKDDLTKCEARNRELKGEIMKKMSQLQGTSNRLEDVQNKHGKNITDRVAELEAMLQKKDAELLEFENVLVKAEETIEKLKKSLKEKER